jgi:competence protein ComEC
MQKCGFYFNVQISCSLLFFLCTTAPEKSEPFRFSVVNVGQGLSQIGIFGETAEVWDMGPMDGYKEWLNVYQKAGKPWISSIIISHRDLDHSGGLGAITQDINWSGEICLSTFEDTAIIGGRCVKWGKPLYFRRLSQGDTLQLGAEVQVKCIWPPNQVLKINEEFKPNKFSLAFKVTHGFSTILITSDIDSAVCEDIFCGFGEKIKADIFVVPHHGSIFSYNYNFFSSVQPNCAIISYGENTYGHPSPQIISLLFSMDCQVGFTAENGSYFFNSNGYYWSQLW